MEQSFPRLLGRDVAVEASEHLVKVDENPKALFPNTCGNRVPSEEIPIGFDAHYGLLARIMILLAHMVVIASFWWPCLLASLWLYATLQFSSIMISRLIHRTKDNCWMQKSDGKVSTADTELARHVVLVSHYKEAEWIVKRTLDAVGTAAAHAEWPVTVVHAVESGSCMKLERWDLDSLRPGHVEAYHVATHERGLVGERPGLGSNLRNAVNFILQETDIPVEDTMVTKIDGNAVLGEHYFQILEAAWQAENLNPHIAYQPMINEIGHEEWQMIGIFNRLSAYLASVIHVVPTKLYPCSGFHSSFCMPLEMIVEAGSWDPWLIQEDNLMCQRAYLALKGNMAVQLLHTEVFNAPTLDASEHFQQINRCIVHGWYAVGFVLGNIHLLGDSLRAKIYYALMTLAFPLGSVITPLSQALFPIFVFPYLDTSMRVVVALLAVLTFALSILGPVSSTKTWKQCVECLVMPLYWSLMGWLSYLNAMYFFFFARDSTESYKTTATLENSNSQSQ